MAGKRQKHPSRLLFSRAGRDRSLTIVTEAEGRPAPPCPDRVHPEARLAWEKLWKGHLSATIADTDLPALYRWLWWLDRWLKAASDVERRGDLVRGARGDRVLNPSVRFMRAAEAVLERLEEAFGMTPLSRMRLGLTFSESKSALARLNLRTSGRPRERVDPRRCLERDV